MEAKYLSHPSTNRLKANRLLSKSIPRNERIPKIAVNVLATREMINYYSFYDANTIVGLIYYMETDKLIYILYLAVNPKIRSKGYGSKILDWIKNKSNGRPLVIDLESIDESAPNIEQRIKRLNFYKKNGFILSNIVIEFRGSKYSLMSTSSNISIDDYKELIKQSTFNMYKPNILEAN